MTRIFLIYFLSFFSWSSSVIVPESSFMFTGTDTTSVTVNRFDSAVAVIKRYEGWHTARHYPYVGYGHKLKKGETFSHLISVAFADSLLRADLLQRCAAFRRFGKDSLLLATLAYNVGEYRLLGTKTIPKSQLIRKLEAGNRDIYKEYVTFRKYNGRIVASLERRRKDEYRILFIND